MPALAFSKLTGQEGALMRGGMVAASLGPWSLETDGASYRLNACVESVDAFWSSQRPLDLRLYIGQSRWVWHGVELEIGDGRAMGVLTGRPEEL